MKLSAIEARLGYWFASGKCVYLRSAPGRGKTSVITDGVPKLAAATGLNLGIVVINGPLLTPADSIGYLVPRKVTGVDGVERMESVYTDPFWFRTAEGKRLNEYDGGIVFVDEADKMDVDVKKVIGEAALSGRLGPHHLPKGWRIWMAGNRQKDRSGSTKELDHLINRRMEIEVTDDVESWNGWAAQHGVSPLVRAFTNQNPQIVFADELPKEQGPFCTPRSIVEADMFLNHTPKGSDGIINDDAETMEEVAGMIGEAATAQLFAFVKLEREMPKFEDIIADPKGCKVPQNKPDAAMLVCFNLAHRVTKETCAPVIDYINRLPKEFGVIFGRSAARRDPSLLNAPAFTKWCRDNAELMAQIGAMGK